MAIESLLEWYKWPGSWVAPRDVRVSDLQYKSVINETHVVPVMSYSF